MRIFPWWANASLGVGLALALNVAMVVAVIWWKHGDYGGFGVSRAGLVAMVVIGFIVGSLAFLPRLDPLVPAVGAVGVLGLYALALVTKQTTLPYDLGGGEIGITLGTGMPFVVSGVLVGVAVGLGRRRPTSLSAFRSETEEPSQDRRAVDSQ